MRAAFGVTILAVMAILASAVLVAQSTAEAEFRTARELDRVRGETDQAIAAYQMLVERHADDPVAPKALLELAGLYERIGDPAARSTYQRIVSSYGASKEASVARERLGGPPQKNSDVIVRRVRGGGYSISGDGRYFAGTDENGNLVAWDTSSEKTRQLTTGASWDADFVEDAEPSPDGKLIAYTWWLKGPKRYDVRIVAISGGASRTILEGEAEEDFLLVGWSPDAKGLILGVNKAKSASRDIVALPLNGSSGERGRLIRQFDDQARNFHVSPDGRWLAFTRSGGVYKQDGDVYVCSTDGGAETPLRHHPADDIVIGWLPDSSGVLYVSDRLGAYGIWAMPIATTGTTADPVLIKSNTGTVSSLGVTKAGDFYFETFRRDDHVSIATLDPDTGKQIGGLAPIEGRYVAGQTQAAWSPDGKRIVYAQASASDSTRAQPISRRGTDQQKKLVIQSVSGGELQVFDVPLMNFQNPTWAANGQAILMQGNTEDGRQGLYRFDISLGKLTSVAARDPNSANQDPNRTSAVLTPDGRLLIFKTRAPRAQQGGVAPVAIVARELSSGNDRVIVPNGVLSFALSPDGRSLALVLPPAAQEPQLRLMPMAGGTPTPIGTSSGWNIRAGAIAWNSDGRSLFVVKDNELWRVPVDGSAPRFTGITENIARISVNPDGRQLALSIEGTTSETWAMKNLPSFKK